MTTVNAYGTLARVARGRYRREDTMDTKTQTRSLVVCARRWFDRHYGNSYFTAAVVVDGRPVAVVPFTYGHGDLAALDAATRAATEAGVEGLPHYSAHRAEQEAAGWTVYVEVAEVERKRDLHLGGKQQ